MASCVLYAPMNENSQTLWGYGGDSRGLSKISAT